MLVAAAVLAALVAAPAALGGPSLRIGGVDDAAVWDNPGVEMDRARLAGFDSVRMTVQWTAGQAAPSSAQLALVRRASQAALSRGIRPILSVYEANAGSTPDDDASRALFVQFLRAVVQGVPEVSTFIVGNEPNSGVYWRPQFDPSGGDAAAVGYERLLADGYDAIKALRPDATVIGGALDSRGSDDPAAARQSHSPTAFIRDLGATYRASGRTRPLMDVFDEHVYQDTSALPPSMAHPGGTSIAEGDYGRLVALLGEAFDGTAQPGSTLPIFYGEYGVESTIPAAESGAYAGAQPAAAPTVDEATQARYYTEAFKLALCQPNVVGIMVFHVVDERDLGGWQSAPFYADGTPKSSLAAIDQAAEAARAGTLATCPDRTPPTVTIETPIGGGAVVVDASDDIGVGRVQLLVNGVAAGVRHTAPYVFPWRPSHPGRYALAVQAVDAAGNVGSVSLTVGAVPAARSGASGGGAERWRLGTPPANDLLAAARRIGGPAGRVAGTTAFATSERGEPRRQSVWYSWRASADGRLKVAAHGARVAVYDGATPRTLRLLGAGGDLDVRRGRTYRIAVTGANRPFVLRWRSRTR